MRFLIFSDIHGNYIALEQALKEAEKMNIDSIIWCGDYITDFPESHQVLQLIKQSEKKYKCYTISGNREEYILKYDKLKNKEKIDIKMRTNIISTYNQLTKEDLEWIRKLPSSLEIKINEESKIYVSHKGNYTQIENCKYKIFGHLHKQFNFRRKDIKYINPGSIGITSDVGVLGAQFSILDITDTFEKLEEYYIKYNIRDVIEKVKKSEIYKDEIQWGKLLIKALETGIDTPNQALKEYNKIREERKINKDSIEIWKIAMQRVL